ncbi:MAG TPA: hypothetical protein VK548_09980 [Candidatus Acidoferrum sp.]|nr:hypothetical protein [Candidatus Acidoferrum sp.]
MTRRRSALIMVVIGVILALVSLLADAIGVGGDPGFGYKQGAGLVVGVVLVAIGLWRGR